MHQALEQHYKKYQLEKASFLNHLDSLTQDQLEFKPAPEEWSLLELANHLYKVEQLTHASVLKGISRKEMLSNGGLGAWMRYKLVALVLAFNKKIKAPVAALLPDKNLTWIGLKQDWLTMSQRWHQTLDTFPPELINKGIFKHPLAGLFTIQQALLFMRDHMMHHQAQVIRLQKQYKKVVSAG